MNNRCLGDKNLPTPNPSQIKKVRPVKIECLDLYDDKVVAGIGGIEVTPSPEIKDALECFKLYRRRNQKMTGDPTNTGVDERYETFINALNNSYNSEKVKIIEKKEIYPHYEEEYLSLITPDEKKGIKNISCPKEILPEVGKILYWIRDDSYWLITSYEETEKAYFKGTIEKCNYILSWRDEKGNIYKQRVKMQGPVETKYKNENLGDFIMGRANETNTLWLAKTEQTEHLKRYKKLILNGKAYDITVINDVSSIIELNLVEGYINPDEDTLIAGEEIAEGQIPIDYDVYSSLDGITELPLTPFKFSTTIYKDGQLLDIKPIITVSENANYNEGMIYPLVPGKLTIRVCYLGYPVDKIYEIDLIENQIAKTYYEILGPDTIDMYGSASYQLIENTGGNEKVLDANLINVDSRDVGKAVISSKNNISVVVASKKISTFRLFALVNGEKIEKSIRIINPW